MIPKIEHNGYRAGLLEEQDYSAFMPLFTAFQIEHNPENPLEEEKIERLARLMFSHEHTRIFGICNGDQLVGYSVITDLDRSTADFYQTYIDPEHRGKKLTGVLYDLRFHAALEHSNVQAAKLTIHGGITASERAAKGQGFERKLSYNPGYGEPTTDVYEQPIQPLREFFRNHVHGTELDRGLFVSNTLELDAA